MTGVLTLMHQIEGPSVTIFLQKGGWVIWLIRWQIKKKGYLAWNCTKSRQFNTFLILLENFYRKSNNWGSLGVRSCKKGRHSVKKKKMQKRGSTVRRMTYTVYRPMGVCPPPPSSWPNEVFTCLVTCNLYYNLTNLATGNHPTWKV